MSDKTPPGGGTSGSGEGAIGGGTSNPAHAVTADEVAANRLQNLKVPKGKQEAMKGLMKPRLLGLLTEEQHAEFEASGPEFIEEVLALGSLKDAKELHQPLRKLMEYSVLFDCSCAVMYLSLYKHFNPNATKEQMKKAFFYAWAQSLAFGLYFPLDDWVDKASTRRFVPAYYLKDGPRKTAMRVFTLFQAVLEALTIKFKDEPFGFELVRRFAFFATLGTAGQTLDAHGHRKQDKMWDLSFREEHNKAVCSPATHLPFEAAAIMAGRKLTSEDWDILNPLMTDVYTITRNMNDFSDVFPKNPTGKPLYTDIAGGDGSWCSGTAWKLANDEQKKVLKDNYGGKHNENIAKVLQVYNEVNLKDKYSTTKKDLVQSALIKFAKCPNALVPKKAFMEIFKFMAADHELSWC